MDGSRTFWRPNFKKFQKRNLSYWPTIITRRPLVHRLSFIIRKPDNDAIEQSANNEAIQHFTQALELLKTLPDDDARLQKELTLQISLGAPLVMTKGYGAPEVENAYTRARELCQRMGETRQLFTALRGLWVFYLVRAQYRMAHQLGAQLLSIANSERDPALLMEAHMTLGIPLFYLPDFTRARAHLAEAITLYDPERHRAHAFRYGQDPGIACQGFEAWALGLLGYPNQARALMDETLRLAVRQSHPFSLAYALHFESIVHQLCREPQLAEQRAEAEVSLSQEQGFPLFVGGGTAFQGWALVEKGQKEGGIGRMRQGIEFWHATGAELARSYWLILLADAYGIIGQPENGFATLTQATSAIEKNEEHFYEPELYRIKGELLLLHRRGQEVEAEACFQKAIEVARRQKTKTLELRAVVSLSRLWNKTAKRHEARVLLGGIHSWFTEGFDTIDLRNAEALLQGLK